MIRGCGGCVTILVLGIVIEVLIAAICINVFGLSEGSTFCFVLAALCIVLAFAACYDDKPTHKTDQNQKSRKDNCSLPNCPYCFSVNTMTDENGIGFCYDCKSYWEVEDAP